MPFRTYGRFRRRRAGRKKYSKVNIGYPIGSRTTKVYQATANQLDPANGNSNIAKRTLYSYDLTNLPSTDNNTVNERQRNVINCRGFRIWMLIRNTIVDPVYFNIAIVAPREESLDLTIGSGGLASLATEFFSDQATPSKKVAFATARSALAFRCLPISTEKLVVLRHKRYDIAGIHPGATSVSKLGDNKPSVRVIKKFYKLRRQLRYLNSLGTNCENKVYLMYWFDEVKSYAGTTAGTPTLHLQQNCQLFFREPKN